MILASRNDHKVRELGEILTGVELRGLPDEIESPPETGATFEANALIKARSARAATGETVIADDSGLEVDELDGRPGVYSARYAGEGATDAENLDKALADLAGASGQADGSDSARYVCVIALIDDSGEHLFRGTCEGRLIQEPRGEGGFGYDPAFVPEATGPGDQRTMAELTPAEKHAISHRGAAAQLLAEHLSA
ncbi:MAG: RdgB/HAM1 family non-canonical purine NTP pyrophosphatase [Solirubrobacterales bacterium]|nr:RdgB/HAM1 family non-canonical purine NTP pyrophosphatase [Solirubrobacterales bacterium]OJU93522.1 MAG: non-canonical purine NTP pyrophosphatase, RdgB/HAM1 family [Solirubrobacterales bacterium 67-14]